MPIVYYLDYPCPVKEQVPPGRMLRLLYAMERANEAINRERAKNPDISPDDINVTLSLKDSKGTRQLRGLSVAEIRAQHAELERLSHHCVDCRAQVERRAFGCRGRIDHPISLNAEKFLMGRIHASGGDPTAFMLANYFESNGITGNAAAEKRRLRGVFFESDKALTRRLEDGRRISANQIFELLLESGPIAPRHARFLLGMFDMLVTNLPMEKPLESLPNPFVVEREDAGLVVSRIGLPVIAGPKDRSMVQVENYFGALLLGSEFGHEVWIK